MENRTLADLPIARESLGLSMIPAIVFPAGGIAVAGFPSREDARMLR